MWIHPAVATGTCAGWIQGTDVLPVAVLSIYQWSGIGDLPSGLNSGHPGAQVVGD